MLIGQGVAFEARSQQDVLVVDGHQTKCSRGSRVQLLEGLQALSEIIPEVNPGEGEIASKNEVLAQTHRERIHGHGAPRGKGLDLDKTLPLPAEDLGVANEAREAEVKNFPHPKVLHHLHISQLGDLGEEGKLLLTSVPLVNHRWLRGTREDKVRLSYNVNELHMCVPVPRMQGLVRVKAIAVPTINAGGASFGAVGYYEVPLSIQLEGLHKVRLSHSSGVYVLDLYKALRVFFPSVTTGRLS